MIGSANKDVSNHSATSAKIEEWREVRLEGSKGRCRCLGAELSLEAGKEERLKR